MLINLLPKISVDKYKLRGKRAGRGAVLSGLTHECGVFGAIATEWPTQVI